MKIHITQMSQDHVRPAVDVHMRSFQTFFLTFLGPAFLREFYASFVVDEEGIGVVAMNDTGALVGIAVGSVRPEGYFKRLLRRRWWAFCKASLWAALRRPSIIPRLFRAMFYRGEAPPGPPRSLLSSIAVEPSQQRGGVGRALVEAWVAEAGRRGSKGCFLTTDAEGNDAVNAFYQRLGWTLETSYETPEGRRMNRYVLDFPQTQE